ncbi:flagellar basal body rod protein FlgB [Nitratiruptor sp. SB155-2]|uniref:flagellar basal body rod protein FlgB n=1 Tax=Nitratiruptor sp. (strain SB155-2) TaxID=387092 RepID=UPI0001586DCC|nr:flagellar basal body rod protein FlgB [Nitratiruptor sp. SB155-2]BAF69735.1 flagellar basal-body rod protein FlgB [Nitratiruptor sp. SB155-2]
MWDKVDGLEKAASFFFERSKVIQGNIANADTPNFKPKELVFEQELKNRMELKKTDPKHIDPQMQKGEFKEVELGQIRGYDNNRVDIQEELAKLAESSIMYKSLSETLKKEFTKLKLAITGR